MFQRLTNAACMAMSRTRSCVSSCKRNGSSITAAYSRNSLHDAHVSKRYNTLSLLPLAVFASILVLSCALFPCFSYAGQSEAATNTSSEPSQSNDAKPYWTWDDATKTLNFYYGEMPASGTEVSLERYTYGSSGVRERTWNNHEDDCEHAVIDASFKDLASVPYIRYWFAKMSVLKDVTGLGNVNGVTDAGYVFYDSENLESEDLKDLNFSEVNTIESIFSSCKGLRSLDLSGLNAPQLVSADSAFSGCVNLQTVNFVDFSAPLLNNISFMFNLCSSLTFIDLSGFHADVSNNYSYAFKGCSNLKEVNVAGLTFSSNLGISPSSSYPYYGLTLSRIIASPGSFDYLDKGPCIYNPSEYAPAGNFYAYQNGSEVPGDSAGTISTSRITGDTPTIFIADKSATYTDYFFANSGSFSTAQSSSQAQALGDVVQSTSGTITTKATAPGTPVRDGYIFKGWTTADGTPVEKDAAGNYDFGNYGIGNSFAFYASWQEGNPVDLTFDANGGTFASTGGATITFDNQVPGETLASVEEPKQEGYTFAGWEDAAGASVVFPLTIPEANTTYKATWTAEPGPGPTPPGPSPEPTPTPTPEPTPATDGSDILPVTGDTTQGVGLFGSVAAGLGVVLALLGGVYALAQKRDA